MLFIVSIGSKLCKNIFISYFLIVVHRHEAVSHSLYTMRDSICKRQTTESQGQRHVEKDDYI